MAQGIRDIYKSDETLVDIPLETVYELFLLWAQSIEES